MVVLWLCRGVRGAALGEVRLLPGALCGRDGDAAHPATRALLLLQPGAALRHHQRDGARGVHAAGRVRREDGPQRDHRALAHCVHDGGRRDGAAHQRRRPAARHLLLLHHAYLGVLARRLQYFYTTVQYMLMLIRMFICSCSRSLHVNCSVGRQPTPLPVRHRAAARLGALSWPHEQSFHYTY